LRRHACDAILGRMAHQKITHAWRSLVVFVALVAVGLSISCRERKPCHEITPVPAHLNDLESYRQRVVEDAVEEAENREGDGNRFKTESARRRVLAIPDEDLERDRQRELAAAMRSREELARLNKGCSPR